MTMTDHTCSDPKPSSDPRDHRCPRCHAKPGEPCGSLQRVKITRSHSDRTDTMIRAHDRWAKSEGAGAK
jgi:hypothetical protein